MTPEDFYKALKELGFDLSQKQKDQFQRYFELLVEWNEKINLTAITDKDEVFLKHFYDSLAPVLQGHIKNQSIQLLDIGAGAGFPSLPIKILCPNLDVTIIDSLNKRITSLTSCLMNLDLAVFTSITDVLKILDKIRPSVLNLILLLPVPLHVCKFSQN